MAKTIPQLTDATTVNAADELIIQQGGITKRATASELFSGTATVTSTGSTTGRSLKDRFADVVNVKDFGAVGDGVADDTAAIASAIASIADIGGIVYFPQGIYTTTSGITIGNGTDASVSSTAHRITLRGAGGGTGTEITNVKFEGSTVIRYTGGAASVGVVNIQGPVTQVQMFDMQLDCNGAAQFGLYQNHLYAGTFQNITVVNFTSVAYYLTSRSGFPVGCAYGNADNRYIGCYSNNPHSLNTTSIVLTSGADPLVPLLGKPDTARCTFVGGSFVYGGNTDQHGAYLNGADNNTFLGTLFFPASGSSGGFDIYLQQWAGDGLFPLENYFTNIGMIRGVGGNGGVGSGYGNMFFPFNTSDGAAFPPAVSGLSGGDQLGRSFVAGVRSYRGRQISQAESQTTQSTASNTFVDAPGYSVTLNTVASCRLNITFSGSAIKNTAGEGFFIINVDGVDYGPSQSVISSSGAFQNATCSYLIDIVTAGSHTAKMRFRSNDANTVSLIAGTIIVQELF